jgi:glycosyltransferase involved in cell wall biosynthesis
MNDHPTIALVMISNFGRADGGRETWAYQFLPRLLARYPDLRLTLFGLRVDGEADSSGDLRDRLGDATNRVALHFFRARRNRIPNLLFMVRAMALYVRRGDGPAPAFTLCVGSVIEYLCAMASPRLRRSPGIVWLRSIFVDEKVARIPRLLQPLFRALEIAILRKASLLIANGDDTAAYYRARGLTVEVIKNAVELDRWKMAPPALLLPIKVGFIGRIAVGKGINEFIDLAINLRGEERGEQQFEFHVIGDGPRLPRMQEAVRDGVLHHHGSVPNEKLRAKLLNMDVCVALTHAGNPKQSSGSGVSHSLLEQMASRRVLVAWDNAAFRNVLDEESAYLVEQGSMPRLLEALREIAARPHSAKAKAERAFLLVSYYSYEAHMLRFANVVRPFMG